MNKKLIGVGIGIALLVSPLLASAQTTSSSNSSLTASLQQLIITLTQELQQLIAARGLPSSTNVNFTVTPATGSAPLTVSFWNSPAVPNDAIDFGDGSPLLSLNGYCSAAMMGNACGANHTYASAGTYTARIVTVPSGCNEAGNCGSAGSVVSSATVTVTNGTAANGSCAYFSIYTKGTTDATTSGGVSKLQRFLGMPNVTGYYGAQTSIAYQNKCGNLGNAQPTSLPGMSKYSDSDFGFSFWYPSSWTVVTSNTPPAPQGGDGSYQGTFLKTIMLSNGTVSFPIYEYSSASGAIQHGISAKADQEGVYFDSASGQWMDYSDYKLQQGVGNFSTPADTSNNTMGGLHIFYTGNVVPLSAQNFVIVDPYAYQYPNSQPLANALTNTIVATNPAVAIPVSTSQQTATIHAEASAYGVSATGSSNASTEFSATPTSGSAPLAVTFYMNGNAENFATVDFGDGSSIRATDLINAHSCSGAGQGTTCWHSYLTSGVYTAIDKNAAGNVLGTATITVTR